MADVYEETQRTIEMAHQALTYLPQADAINRTFAKSLLGRTYYFRGEFSQAVPTLVENISECIQAEATNYLAPTLNTLSKIYRIEGRLRDAIELLREGCAFIEARDPRRVTVAGVAFLGRADVQREWNHLEDAEELALRSLELSLPWKNPSSICSSYSLLVRIYLAKGEPGMAEEALGSAMATVRGRKPMAGVISDLNYARVCFWLATGQIQKASQWALGQKKMTPGVKTDLINQEQDDLTIARVWVAEGKPDLALPLLAQLAEAAEKSGRFGRLIEIHILQAVALQASGEQTRAHGMLERALRLAETEGYLRIFMDEGQPISEMLAAYIKTTAPTGRSYAQKIINTAAVSGQAGSAMVLDSNLTDPLTPREIDILQGMAQGLSNREIAQQLILAEGTVKFYVHAVLEKLGVHTRTQAILEAKKLKII
jgi:LuxR family maltose regulon positive regulatory protein